MFLTVLCQHYSNCPINKEIFILPFAPNIEKYFFLIFFCKLQLTDIAHAILSAVRYIQKRCCAG